MFWKQWTTTLFLSFKFLFYFNPKKNKKKMYPLSRLSLILTIVCVFIPILILSITNGFQYFSLDKLQKFYAPYSLKLNHSINQDKIPINPLLNSFYEDFILIKGKGQEAPSLMRVINAKALQKSISNHHFKLLSGYLPKKNQILIGESLAMQIGLSSKDKIQAFIFTPNSPMPIRKTNLSVSGIISFENASLDRVVSFILPTTLESQFFIGKNQINLISSYNKKQLSNLHIKDGELLELSQTPSVKQMNQQHQLLMLLVLASSFLCFFSLYMNLKTNINYHTYSMNVLKVLGLKTNTTIQLFFIQNILLVVLGIIIGTILCFSIIPFISPILSFLEHIVNIIILFLKGHFAIFKHLETVEFLPADIFYIQAIPVKIMAQDFIFIFSILIIGTVMMNYIYYTIWLKNTVLQSLKMQTGV